MSQLALPFATDTGAVRVLAGAAVQPVLDAFARTGDWPFRTAILTGPPRSGKSLLARYFAENRLGDAIDDADALPEDTLFHRWNRAQAEGTALLLVNGQEGGGWRITLPDLASRLGSALLLEIGRPDDALLAELAEEHAARRGLILAEGALAWLVPRLERSHAGVEKVMIAADRLSLERQQPVTISLLREALAESGGGWQPRLL